MKKVLPLKEGINIPNESVCSPYLKHNKEGYYESFLDCIAGDRRYGV